MKKIIAAGVGVCALTLAFAAKKDPVIMTVNGVDVPKSEFEYLYNKNSQQQINPQTLDEYVDMFKLYKLKVAEARAEGIDTTAAFVKEATKYRHDLAAPYLADSIYINQLVAEAYDRSKEEVESYHIMLFKAQDLNKNKELRQRADSIHDLLINGADFETLVKQYSQDRGSNTRGGRMGWIKAGAFPAAYEIAAFGLKEGEISDVVESPQGYHILKGGKHRKARGQVQVAHILKLTQGKDEAGRAAAKAAIDSLYNVALADPDHFTDLALANSEDPSVQRGNGMLPWFGCGEMVEQFDSAAFALKVGEISRPVETAYGYHLIKKYGEKGIPTLEEMKPQAVARITNAQDPRFRMIRQRQIADLAPRHKASLSEKTIAAIRAEVEKNGIDSALMADWTTIPAKAKMTIATVDGKKHNAAEFAKTLKNSIIVANRTPLQAFDERVEIFYSNLLRDAEEDRLAQEEPDYKNLLKEYVDGSLLYEISLREVWDKANKDTEGLEAYFNANRDNYTWEQPHAKGYLVQVANDSIADLVRTFVADIPRESLIEKARKEFKRDIAIDRVCVSQGTNAMVDNIVFGGPEIVPNNKKLPVYFMIDARVVASPEEVSDVKGLVINDYQNYLQQNWEDALRRKYPVTVNEKVLRTVTPIEK